MQIKGTLRCDVDSGCEDHEEPPRIVVSTASVWEMVLKNAKGKLALPQGAITEQFEAQGLVLPPILPRHIEAVRACPGGFGAAPNRSSRSSRDISG